MSFCSSSALYAWIMLKWRPRYLNCDFFQNISSGWEIFTYTEFPTLVSQDALHVGLGIWSFLNVIYFLNVCWLKRESPGDSGILGKTRLLSFGLQTPTNGPYLNRLDFGEWSMVSQMTCLDVMNLRRKKSVGILVRNRSGHSRPICWKF